MPTSELYQLNEIMELIVLTNPKKMLDVGVGFGKYGLLSREYLELWDGREKYHDWKRQIDGIEVNSAYITPIHDYAYDKLYIGNALDILPNLKTEYDLILLIDILEHFEYTEGIKILESCRRIGRNMIISTPKHIGSQEDSFGNPFETHRFQWSRKHFDRYSDKFFIQSSGSIICFVGKDQLTVNAGRILKTPRVKSETGRRFPLLKKTYKSIRRYLNKDGT